MKLLRGFVLTMIMLFVAIYWWHSYFDTPDASTMTKETTAQKGATNQRAVPVNTNNTSVVPTDKVSSAQPVEMPQPPACPFSTETVRDIIKAIDQASDSVSVFSHYGSVYMAGFESRTQAENILGHPNCQQYSTDIQRALNVYNQRLEFAKTRSEREGKELRETTIRLMNTLSHFGNE